MLLQQLGPEEHIHGGKVRVAGMDRGRAPWGFPTSCTRRVARQPFLEVHMAAAAVEAREEEEEEEEEEKS